MQQGGESRRRQQRENKFWNEQRAFESRRVRGDHVLFALSQEECLADLLPWHYYWCYAEDQYLRTSESPT